MPGSGRLVSWVLLAALATVAHADEFTATPLAEPPHDLRQLLATIDGEHLLSIDLAAGRTVEGYPHRVVADTLLLTTEEGAAPLLRAPLAEIVKIRQRRSGAASGAGWGAVSGVVAGGALGALFGIVVASIDDDDGAGPIVAFSLGGVAAGALLGSGIGAGIGAMTHGWRTVYPLDESDDFASVDEGSPRTRLCLEPGWNFGVSGVRDSAGLGARLGVLRRLGGRLEMGPFIEYHDISGVREVYPYYGGVYLDQTSRLLAVGIDVRANGTDTGWRPFGTGGTGWCVSNDLYLGGHLGGGIRWRGDSGHEFSLGARRYFSLTGGQARIAQFWSVTAGIAVGL